MPSSLLRQSSTRPLSCRHTACLRQPSASTSSSAMPLFAGVQPMDIKRMPEPVQGCRVEESERRHRQH